MAGPDASHPAMPARLWVPLFYGGTAEKFRLLTAFARVVWAALLEGGLFWGRLE
jgi:hypothetical protein